MWRSYLLVAASFSLSCSHGQFLESSLETKTDIRGMVALCYRAQKDNAASGGGNTRNCDTMVKEYLRQEKFRICRESKEVDKCYSLIYKASEGE